MRTTAINLMLTPINKPLFTNMGGVPGFSGDLSLLEGNPPINKQGFLNPGSTGGYESKLKPPGDRRF